MSCTNITTCYEVGTTYKDRFLNFPDDLDGLTDFRYVVKSALGATLLTLTEGNGIERLGANNMCLQSAQLQDLDPGTYSTTFFYKLNGNDRKLFTETLEISIDGCDCANIYNLAFTIIPVDIEETVIEIRLNFDDLTPEQQLALTGPKGDTFTFDDMTDENKEELRPAINISQFNHITGSFTKPNFSWPSTGWNSNIREIGNIIEYENSLIFIYTGYPVGDYTSSTIYIGALQSFDDGETWEDLGQITESSFEDPYIVYFKGEYYLYSEKKSGSNHLGINLHKGPDLFSLVDMGVVLGRPETVTDWDFADRSSPAVIVINDQLVMFFEGRSGSQHGNRDGAIGRATSNDGINWSVDPAPLVVGYNYTNPMIGDNTISMKWASHIVPDDIIKVDGKYVMTAHAYNSRTFACALLISEDLLHWRDATGTWITTGIINNENSGNGVMLYLGDKGLNGYYIWVLNGQFHFFKGAFANNSLDSVANGNTGYKISPAGRNEYLDYSAINSNRTQTLGYDENSAQGIVKFIKNNTAFTLTINAEPEVTIDGLTTLEIPAFREVCLIASGSNVWKVWSVRKTTNAPEEPSYTPWIGTQAEYNALTPESGTIYFII